MRVAIIALGSRGDVQPYIALGHGLDRAGHDVRLIAHENFEGLVRSHGLAFWPARGNVEEVMQDPELRELLEKGNFIAITARTAKEAKRAALHWARDGLAACQDVDLIIAGLGGMFIGIALAEKLGIPFLQAYLVPFTPTRAFPSVLLPASLPRLGGLFNRVSHHLTRQMMWQGSRASDTSARKQVLDLPAAPLFGPFNSEVTRRLPVLYGFSPSVIPNPPDWDSRNHVTGYWFLDSTEDWTPPAALVQFLEDGPPPVYVGFGSMGSRKPEETTDLVLQALAKSEQRAVLVSGWHGLQNINLPDSVFMVDSVPHAWLFPRVAAVVHHGGAGTTAAGLRAGVPSVITPFFGDQPFWGHRVAQLGVGPEPIPRKKLTADSLSRAIVQAVSDESIRQRAAQVGAAIRNEDGVARAVEVIEAAMRK